MLATFKVELYYIFNQNNTIMTTLDDDRLLVDPSTVSPWPIAIRYGLISALIACIYTLISNMSGLTAGAFGLMASTLSGLVVFAIGIAMIVIPVKHHRDKELGGYITIGRVILIGMVVTAISMLLSNVFNYVYMNFIDPGFLDTMMAQMEESMGSIIPEEQMDEFLLNMQENFEPMTMLKNGLMMGTVFGLIVSGIIGLIMKKDPPRA